LKGSWARPCRKRGDWAKVRHLPLLFLQPCRDPKFCIPSWPAYVRHPISCTDPTRLVSHESTSLPNSQVHPCIDNCDHLSFPDACWTFSHISSTYIFRAVSHRARLSPVRGEVRPNAQEATLPLASPPDHRTHLPGPGVELFGALSIWRAIVSIVSGSSRCVISLGG
jgi:hypothetical protein